MRAFSICCLYFSKAFAQILTQHLGGNVPVDHPAHYTLVTFEAESDFLDCLCQDDAYIDCLIIEDSPASSHLFETLQKADMIFPTVVVQATAEASPPPCYHSAIVSLPLRQIEEIQAAIDQSISQFIQLSPTCPLPILGEPSQIGTAIQPSLVAQQDRLADKLKERLGYLGVYYKRNPQNFLRHMTRAQREELLNQLRSDYRDIILNYFSDDRTINDKIDNFVNTVFFADMSVSQIVEIHMELMDEFSKQLKLEGRGDEILQDYRLTLIDAIAHLCEMYRRSIPRQS